MNNDITTTTAGRIAQVYRDNGDKWPARIEADSTEVLRRLVCAIEGNSALIAQRDALVAACEMLTLAGDDPDAGGFWGRYDLALELAATALALVKGEQ